MKTIEKYVFGAFLSSFTLAFLMLSFVLTIGLLVQVVEFIMDGVPMSLVTDFCVVSLPETLQWSMPLALLVSSILVFSRLSADSEISAMRACGINVVTVMKWPLLFALFCTLVGFWVNNEIVTRGHEVRRSLKTKMSVETGLSVLEPGRIIDDFPKMKLYFGGKEGNWLHDLVVVDYSTPEVDRIITADKALVVQSGKDINLELYHMTIDPVDAEHQTMARANRFVYSITNVLRKSSYTKKLKDFRFFETLENLKSYRKGLAAISGTDRRAEIRRRMIKDEASCCSVELNKRFVFAMASLCFVLIGVPLGIRSQRKESTIGMAISLAVALGYYLLVVLMLSLQHVYQIHPEVLMWLPVAICLGLSVKFLRRHL